MPPCQSKRPHLFFIWHWRDALVAARLLVTLATRGRIVSSVEQHRPILGLHQPDEVSDRDTVETLIRSASGQKTHQTPKNHHAPRRRRSHEASMLPPMRFCTTKIRS
jgi:hypothetical protein